MHTTAIRTRTPAAHAATYAFYLVIAIVVTWPLTANLSTVLTGFVYGDGHEMAHHIWWFKHALQTGQPLFYQSLMAYPNGIEGITLWAHPLQFFPAWLLAFVLPLPAAANLTILLTLALNGWAMTLLARHLLRGADAHPLYPPALLAGLVYMLFPTMQGHLGAGHAGLLAQWPVPLFVYTMFRLRDGAGPRWIIASGLLFALSTGGHTLQAIYVLLPVCALFLLALLVRREWRALGRVITACALGAVLLGLFLLPVLRETLTTSAYTDEGGAVRYSADLLAIVSPSFFHPLFSSLEYPRRVLGVNIDEGAAYIGLIAALLSAIGLWKRRESRWWLALAVVAWVLSLGPLLKILDQPVRFSADGYEGYVTLPWALLQDAPLFSLGRTAGRFNFTLALAVAALASYGASVVWAWRPARRIRVLAIAGLMALIAFEYQTFWPLPTIPAQIPTAVRDLAARDDVRAVFDVPWEDLVAAKYGLYLQTGHERALIAGQVTRRTPVSPARLTLLETTLDPALLEAAGVDIVIVHREQDVDGVLEARARAQLGAPMWEDQRIAVFETPDAAGVPASLTLVSAETQLEDRLDSYVYAAADGWVEFAARLSGENRQVALLLDDVTTARWTIDGALDVRLPLPVAAGTYHTVSLALEPPCPLNTHPALACRSVEVSGLTLSEQPPAENQAADVRFDGGITLARGEVPASAAAGESLPARLWWQFDAERDEHDVRFVHLVSADSVLVAQVDGTLGRRPAGDHAAEQVDLVLPIDLPAGVYTVLTGWYTYPEIANYCVLSDGACAANALTLGSVEISAAN